MRITTFTFILLVSLFLSLTSIQLFAQNVKNEVERDIKKNELPLIILQTIDKYWANAESIKYFAQTDGQEKSFEIKLKYRGVDESISFTENGNLKDIEVLSDFSSIPSKAQTSIVNEIEKRFSSYKFTRVQFQYSKSVKIMTNEEFIDQYRAQAFDEITLNYELELDAQNKSTLGSFEMLFDKDGILIEQRKIARRSLDNIWD